VLILHCLAAITLLLMQVGTARQGGQGASALPDAAPRPVSSVPSTQPVLVHKVEPEYSEKARRAGIQGEVWLDVSVRADGKVGSVLVAKSLDTMYGLDQRAIAVVRQWVYAARANGDLRVYPPTRVVIPFRLDGDVPVVAASRATTSENFGDGAYRPGQPGLVLPILKNRIEPTYTTLALRNRITGSVRIDAVVLADGTVGRARVAQSLDSKLGLDDRAQRQLGNGHSWQARNGRQYRSSSASFFRFSTSLNALQFQSDTHWPADVRL
jgi:TonB family protein